MTYYDYISKTTALVKAYEKLMEEIKQVMGESGLYWQVYDNCDLVKFNLKFEKEHGTCKDKEFKQKEYQELYDKYSKILENCNRSFLRYKVQKKEEDFIENGTMSAQEFKTKLLEFKKDLEKVCSEINREVGRIWYPKYETPFSVRHEAEERVKQINNIMSRDSFFVKENEKRFRSLYIEFKRVTTQCKSIWADYRHKYLQDRTM